MFERTAPEQHDTLPDIPEPAENPLLFGHDLARKSLAGAYRAGKLHHALLFAGRQGIGKATLAFHLAHHIFSHSDHRQAPADLAEIDTASQSFRLVAQGAHPGLLHLSRPYVQRDKKFKTVITVDEVRRISRFLSLTPPDGGYRIVIVDPVDDMNTNAANALLKNLEEPPPKTLFVLIAHSIGRLLPTIRSRCQTIQLEPLSADMLLQLLDHLGAASPENIEERNLLAERAGGSAREAILMTQFGGLEIAHMVDRIADTHRFAVAEAHKLAEATVGRDREVQFTLFNHAILDRLSMNASRAAAAGSVEKAARLAALWEEFSETVRQAEIFNLDRRQHVLSLLARMHRAMHQEMRA